MTEDAFRSRYGFARGEATLANWRPAPVNRWAFQNTRELVPTASIAARHANDPEAPEAGAALGETVTLGHGPEPVGTFLERSAADILLALKDGRPVLGWRAPHADFDAPHLVFSISKSLTALVAGILVGQGLLDPGEQLESYLPEARGSGYGDATLRDLLDMRVSLDFAESYLDASGGFARYRRATLWNPPEAGAPSESLFDFLMSLGKGEGGHGGPMRYLSPNSDLLGLVIERAAGERFADLMGKLLWQPMEATGEALVTVDREGTARTAGGISVTAWDLARVGELMRQEGAVGTRQVLPPAFVRDTLDAGDPQAWRAGDMAWFLEIGRYRNKWYATGDGSGAFCAIGIHGQSLFVDPARRVTIVKMSSQAEPENYGLRREEHAFLQALAERV